MKLADVFKSLSKKDIAVILFAVFLGMIGMASTDIFLPSMPQIGQTLHASSSQVQHTIPIFIIGLILPQLLYGALSDRFGRKPIILTGLGVAAIGALFAYFSKTIDMLLFARFVQGLGCSVSLPLFRVLIADISTGKQMAVLLSYVTVFFRISPMVAPAAGGYIAHYFHWEINFLVMLLIYVLYGILFWLFCPETMKEQRPVSPRDLFQQGKRLFKSLRFLLPCLSSGLGFSISLIYATGAAYIFEDSFHVQPILFGWFSLMLAIVSIFGKQLNAFLILRFKLTHIVRFGGTLVTLSGILLFLLLNTTNFWSILAAMMVGIVGTAMVMGNVMTLAIHIHEDIKATSISVYGLIQSLVGFFISWIVAMLAHYPPLPTFSTIYVLIGIGIVSAITLMRALCKKERLMRN